MRTHRAETVAPLKVLIADVCPDTAESLAEVLAFHGHLTRAVTDGADAVQTLTGDPPDVLVTDLDLPHVSGGALARLARQQGPERPLLLAVTGHQRAVTVPPENLGFDYVFLKPVDPAAIVGALRRIDIAGD